MMKRSWLSNHVSEWNSQRYGWIQREGRPRNFAVATSGTTVPDTQDSSGYVGFSAISSVSWQDADRDVPWPSCRLLRREDSNARHHYKLQQQDHSQNQVQAVPSVAIVFRRGWKTSSTLLSWNYRRVSYTTGGVFAKGICYRLGLFAKKIKVN